MQQLGGTLGVAVLVTIFGAASSHAHPIAGASAVREAHHVFVYGADRAFLAAMIFLVAAVALVLVAIRAPRTPQSAAASAPEAARH
jgi:hypothetical protein